MSNLYQILGITKDASKNQVKEAFRKLALRYHPDANSTTKKNNKIKNNIKKFQTIKDAHNILSNDIKRLDYDMNTFGTSVLYSLNKTEIKEKKVFNISNNKDPIQNYTVINHSTTSRIKSYQQIQKEIKQKQKRSVPLPSKSSSLNLILVPMGVMIFLGININIATKDKNFSIKSMK